MTGTIETVETVVDSSCLINLCAAGDLATILPPIGLRFVVPPAVKDEVHHLRRRSGVDAVLEAIDLRGAIDAGLIGVCDLESERETELYVEFAAALDDAEAMCIAIAAARHWMLAADDRRALRIAVENGVAMITTPELMRRWAENSSASAESVRTALENIEAAARYVPPRDSPEIRWWTKSIEARNG